MSCADADTSVGDPHGGPHDKVKLPQALKILPHTATADAQVVHGMCIDMPTKGHEDPTGHGRLALKPVDGQYDPIKHGSGSVVPGTGQNDPSKHGVAALRPVWLQNDPAGHTRGSASSTTSAAGQ